MALQKIINLTGDCTNSDSGSAEIILLPVTLDGIPAGVPTNGFYRITWFEPDLGTDYYTLTSTRANLAPGMYNVSISKFRDQTSLDDETFTFNISSGFCTTIVSKENTSCNLDNGKISLSSPEIFDTVYTYNLYKNNSLVGEFTGTPFNVEIINLTADTYETIVRNNCGCTATTGNFIVEPSMFFDYGLYVVPNTICSSESVGKIIVTGETGGSPYTYLWGDGQTGNTITGLTNGVYIVDVTNSYGCTKSKSAIVETFPPLNFTNTQLTQPTCFTNNGEIILTISGGAAPYLYSASTLQTEITYSRTFSLTGLNAGFYSVIVKDSSFCTTMYSTELLTPNSISQFIVSSTNSTCSQENGSITASIVNGAFPYTYTLTHPNGDVDSLSLSQTTYTFENLSTGTYTVSVLDQTGCGSSKQVSIVTENKFTYELSQTGATNINNGIVGVTISSGGDLPYYISIDGGRIQTQISSGTTLLYNVESGQHTVSVKDNSGCQVTKPIFVTSIPNVDFYLTSSNETTDQGGKINVFITKGEPPFYFNWSDNVANNPQDISLVNLSAGTYSLTLKDSNGSTKERTIEVAKNKKVKIYDIVQMGESTIDTNTESRYNILRMLNDGFSDLTSGHTGCVLNTATFKTTVSVQPYDLTLEDIFYTSYSLLDYPEDNLWYDSAKNLLSNLQGVKGVKVDELLNEFIIEGDLNNSEYIIGSNPIVISLKLGIEYDINCLE